MNTRINVVAGFMGLFAMGSAGASVVTCPTTPTAADTNPDTGHYFEVYSATAITWDAARACADAKSHSGVPGHLATLTSSSEDGWVDGLRAGSELGQVWVGGYQTPDSSEPGGGWLWVNSEGPIPGVNTQTIYANWNAAEPNNVDGIESHLTLGRYGLGGGWNDEGSAPESIGGFIVEYDVPRPANCGTDPTNPTCQTIEGQFLSIPPAWIDNPGDTIRFTSYEFTDPRFAAGTCGINGLTLFGAAYGKPELRIPPYLCGHKLVVVAVDGSDLHITKGTVLIENDTRQILDDPGYPYVCKDTKGPIFPTPGEDPQGQDVVVYQTTDPTRMLEDLPGNRGVDPQFAGAAGEFTNACGSSRGSGKETSYFVVGLHVDFGALGSTQEGSHDRFVALTHYKLSLLRQSIVAARVAGALNPVASVAMEALIVIATYRLDHGDPAGALIQVKQFLKLVNAARYTTVASNNYNGEHLMRGTNIEFTLRVKVIPNAP